MGISSTIKLGTLILFLTGSVASQNLIDGAESVSYDPTNDRYLVSSFNNNRIVAIDNQGTQTIFAEPVSSALGNHIYNNVLYVSRGYQPSGVSAYDLTTGLRQWSVNVAGSIQLDGLTTDNAGYLYACDSRTDRLYRFDLSDQSYSIFVATGLPGRPQDVDYDADRNRLLLVGFDDNTPVLEISLPGGVVSELVPDAQGGFDGVTVAPNGRIYVSEFAISRVYSWNADGASPRTVSMGHPGAAGLKYIDSQDILAIPCFNADRIDFMNFQDYDEDFYPHYMDNCPEIYNPAQADADGDGDGDACDLCTDLDGDGFGNPGFPYNSCVEDNCPLVSNPGQNDLDADGVGDECDNCLMTYNPDQIDLDQNSIGDACEGCCQGRVGDANSSGDDIPTIGDISTMVAAKFGGEDCESLLSCLQEADINRSGGFAPTCDDITIGDISSLVDYLFITGPSAYGPLPECL